MALAAMIFSGALHAETYSGEVVGVRDGHSISLVAGGKPIDVRLADIYAPQLRQSFGEQAKISLAELCLSKAATVTGTRVDRFGRLSGRVTCDGVDANAEQVKRGMAWVYDRQASNSSPLYYLQDQAQRSREGLWKERSPVAPWKWRAVGVTRRRH
jgi:endonuclease YncB( thermonuclease family)